MKQRVDCGGKPAYSLCYQSYGRLAHLADHNKGETTQLNHSNMFIKNKTLRYKEN